MATAATGTPLTSALGDDTTPTSALNHEVELKLLAQPGDLARVAALPALSGRADAPARTRRLRTVYYDNAELGLYALGIALRLRFDGERCVQGLKTMADETAGDAAAIAVRREWEWPIEGDQPDMGPLRTGDAAALLPAAALEGLRPIFVTDVVRTTFLVRLDAQTSVEVALDDGEITVADKVRPITEVELELRGGRAGRLFDLALDLHRGVPLRIGIENKAERAFRLLTGRQPAAVVPQAPALSPLTTVADAFRHVVRHCLGHILANEPAALAEGGFEGMSQIRTAVRRLRAALKMFEGVIASAEAPQLIQDVGWLADRLRPGRHWDLLAARELIASGGPALAALIESQRRGPAAAAREALRAPRSTSLILGLGAWLEEDRWHARASADTARVLEGPMSALAGPWLEARHARVRRAGRLAETGGDVARQRLRRRLRALRYAAEFFRGLYPPAPARAYLNAQESLRVALDAIHEAAVANRLLAQAGRGVEDVRAIQASLRQLGQAAERQRLALPELWRAFRETPVFWA